MDRFNHYPRLRDKREKLQKNQFDFDFKTKMDFKNEASLLWQKIKDTNPFWQSVMGTYNTYKLGKNLLLQMPKKQRPEKYEYVENFLRILLLIVIVTCRKLIRDSDKSTANIHTKNK